MADSFDRQGARGRRERSRSGFSRSGLKIHRSIWLYHTENFDYFAPGIAASRAPRRAAMPIDDFWGRTR
jgi:hypothetical protein